MNRIYLDFCVQRQEIKRTNQDTVAAESAGVLYARFDFSEEWNQLECWACVHYGGKILEEPIFDGECRIPNQCIRTPVFQIGVVGKDHAGNVTMTTEVAKVEVKMAAYRQDKPPKLEPTESYVRTVAEKVFRIRQQEGQFEYEIAEGKYQALETPEGAQGKADQALAEAKVYTDAGLEKKVDQEEGKGLSANDYTDEEKALTAQIPFKADEVALQKHINDTIKHVPVLNGSAVSQFLGAREDKVGENPHNLVMNRGGQTESTLNFVVSFETAGITVRDNELKGYRFTADVTSAKAGKFSVDTAITSNKVNGSLITIAVAKTSPAQEMATTDSFSNAKVYYPIMGNVPAWKEIEKEIHTIHYSQQEHEPDYRLICMACVPYGIFRLLIHTGDQMDGDDIQSFCITTRVENRYDTTYSQFLICSNCEPSEARVLYRRGKGNGIGSTQDMISWDEWINLDQSQEVADINREIGEILELETADKSNLVASINELANHMNRHGADLSNPHQVSKSQVGLGNADNTADKNKEVLSATKLKNTRKINGVDFDGTADITITDATKIPLEEKGVPNGVAQLDGDGIVVAGQLPSFVDNILPGDNVTIEKNGNTVTISSVGEVTKDYVDAADQGIQTQVDGIQQDIDGVIEIQENNIDLINGGGAINVVNADRVGGLPVDDTKGGTDETTDNALWSANQIKKKLDEKADVNHSHDSAYAPVSHVNNTAVHLSAEDKTAIGRIAEKADATDLNAHMANGSFHTTTAEKSNWNQAKGTIDTHTADTAKHVTAGEKNAWNGKLGAENILAGDHVTLTKENGNVTISGEPGGNYIQSDGTIVIDKNSTGDKAYEGNIAIGTNASAINGEAIAIGIEASASYGIAIGHGAGIPDGGVVIGHHGWNSGAGIAIGNNAVASDSSVSLGEGARCGGDTEYYSKDGVAIGHNAMCQLDNDTQISAIQIGNGINTQKNTVQFYHYQLLDANGNIPAERLQKVTTDWNQALQNGFYRSVRDAANAPNNADFVGIVLMSDAANGLQHVWEIDQSQSMYWREYVRYFSAGDWGSWRKLSSVVTTVSSSMPTENLQVGDLYIW